MNLEELSIALRDLNYRKEFDGNVILDLIEEFPSMDLNGRINTSKAIANYVSDIEDNTKKIAPIIHKIVFNDEDERLNEIQMILVSNILTTIPDSMGEYCMNLTFNKLVTVMNCNLEMSMELVDEMVDVKEDNEFVVKVNSQNFLKVYGTCGDVPLVLKLSGLLIKGDENTDEMSFKKIITDIKDEQVLLNVSYALDQPNNVTIQDAFKKYQDTNDEGGLRPSLLLMISNFINTTERKTLVVDWLQDDFLIDYFKSYNENFDVLKPWVFQSIVLLNKIPLAKFKIDEMVIPNFIGKLKTLCNKSIIQIRLEVVSLQIDGLSKLLNEITRRNESNTEILQFVNSLYGIDEQLDRVLIRLHLNYLSFVKTEGSEYDKDLLENTIKGVNFNDGKIETKDLSLLSKVMGMYVKDCKEESWFKEIIKNCEELVSQHNEPSSQKDANYSIFLNNLRFIKANL